MAHKAWEHIQEIEVGVNKYRLEKEAPIDILEVDNTAVRKEQIERLQDLKAHRDEAAVKAALDAITECVKTKKGNLLDLAVKAAKVRATLGEISDACEVVVGRYKAVIRTISGVYSSETKRDADFVRATELCEKFAKKEGRQPRIMIAKMGQDGHDRGAKVVATGYADCGFDVDMGPLFQTPAEAARQAVENDVVGLRILSSSTCVGLRYGHALHNSSFSRHMAHTRRKRRTCVGRFFFGCRP